MAKLGDGWNKLSEKMKKEAEQERPSVAQLSLRDVQGQVEAWTSHNFPDNESWHALLGVMEELGELSHAHLKREQGIREGVCSSKIRSLQMDAVADVVIYLLNYCNLEGIDLQAELSTVWSQVKRRDWKQNRETGETEEAAE